jgi:hypothetical protein
MPQFQFRDRKDAGQRFAEVLRARPWRAAGICASSVSTSLSIRVRTRSLGWNDRNEISGATRFAATDTGAFLGCLMPVKDLLPQTGEIQFARDKAAPDKKGV